MKKVKMLLTFAGIILGLFLLPMVMNGCAAADNMGGAPERDSSDTNVQVEGVDEGDIVKFNDEGYVFKAQTDGVTVTKYNTADDTFTPVAEQELSNFVPREMFVTDTHLIVIGESGSYIDWYSGNYYSDKYYGYSSYYKVTTVIYFYGLNSVYAGDSEVQRVIKMPGSFNTSRMTGKRLTVLTNYASYNLTAGSGGGNTDIINTRSLFGTTSGGSNADGTLPDSEAYPTLDKSASYLETSDTLKGAVKTHPVSATGEFSGYGFAALVIAPDGSGDLTAAAFDGSLSAAYFSEDNIVAVIYGRGSYDRNYYGGFGCSAFGYYSYNNCLLRINPKTLKVSAIRRNISESISSRHYIHDDGEYIYTVGQLNGAVLTVYEYSMKVAGRLERIGAGEQLKAVRFEKDFCSIVTFRQIDPLFKIDLTDPTNPTILGELEITGFSSLLQSFGEGYQIGVGYGGMGNSTNCVKITLFDVSGDVPVAIHSYVLGTWSHSEAQYELKAIYAEPEHNLFAIPAYGYIGGGIKQGAFFFSVEDGEISYIGGVTNLTSYNHDYYSFTQLRGEINRIGRIGTRIITVSDGYLKAYDRDLTLLAEADTRINNGNITITFDYTYDDIIETEAVTKGDSLYIFAPNRAGYSFNYWVDEYGYIYHSGDTAHFYANTVLYASWMKKEEIKITFDNTGNSPIDSLTLVQGDQILLPEPAREGYKFNYWAGDDGNNYYANTFYYFYNSVQLTAHWTKLN